MQICNGGKELKFGINETLLQRRLIMSLFCLNTDALFWKKSFLAGERSVCESLMVKSVWTCSPVSLMDRQFIRGCVGENVWKCFEGWKKVRCLIFFLICFSFSFSVRLSHVVTKGSMPGQRAKGRKPSHNRHTTWGHQQAGRSFALLRLSSKVPQSSAHKAPSHTDVTF